MNAPGIDLGRRGYPLRFTLEAEQEEKVAELLRVAAASGVTGNVGTVARTLLELAAPTSDFLGQMRLVGDKERMMRGEREVEREPMYFNLEPAQEEKLQRLHAFARGNGVKGWGSTVVRTLIVMATPSHDFIQQMRMVRENEMTLERARREQSTRKKTKAT